MTANRSPKRFLTQGRTCGPLALAVLVVASLGSDRVVAQNETPAVWKAKEITFFYRGTSAYQSCSELERRVAVILLAVGARDDIDVRASDCDDSMIPDESSWDRTSPFDTSADPFRSRRRERDRNAHVRVRLMMPVEVTPEVLAEIDKDKSRRDLVSRVTRNAAATLNDPVVFPATRQTVTLSRRLIRLEPNDCELLEQMTSSVFRQLDVRVVRRGHTCDQRQSSRLPPQVTVEALVPTGRIPELPTENESDADPKTAPETAQTETEPAQAPAEAASEAKPETPAQ
jgi:hypothetical protein